MAGAVPVSVPIPATAEHDQQRRLAEASTTPSAVKLAVDDSGTVFLIIRTCRT